MENPIVILKQLKWEDYVLAINAAKLFYNDEVNKERMQKILADTHNYLIIASIDGNIAGFVFWYQLDSWHKESKEMLLYDIEVSNKYRRMGIATKLFDEFKSISKKEWYKEIRLPTEKSNTAAVEFYKRMGGIQKHEDDTLFSFRI